jgi:hypothetical protein
MEQGGVVLGTAPPGTVRLELEGKPVRLAEGGGLLLGFDRDQQRSTERLSIAPRAWPVQRLNIARRPGGPTAEYLRLRERELARIDAARGVNAASGAGASASSGRRGAGSAAA